jgi:hypothetical protein
MAASIKSARAMTLRILHQSLSQAEFVSPLSA